MDINLDINVMEFNIPDGNGGYKKLDVFRGEKGEKGDKGEQGIPGEKGDKGDTGNGFKVLGYYDTLLELQSSIVSPNAGDAYGVGVSWPYDIYIYDGVSLEWLNNGTIQGVKGDTGAKGEKGDTGEKGERGEQGVQGEQGIPGEKGDKGDTGERGLQGIPGEKGDTGEKGERGEQGVQGEQGIPGEKGDKGDDGADGSAGTAIFVKRFTEDGTFEPADYPSKDNRYRFKIQGGGGGCAMYTGNPATSAGGGAGAFVEVELTVASSVPIIVGEGGLSIKSDFLAVGRAGANSQITCNDTTYIAPGGKESFAEPNFSRPGQGSISPSAFSGDPTVIMSVPGQHGSAGYNNSPALGGNSAIGESSEIGGAGHGYGACANSNALFYGGNGCVEVYRYV